MLAEHLRLGALVTRARRFIQNDQLILVVLAVLVGGLAGLGTILFREGIDTVQLLGFGSDAADLFSQTDLPWWLVIAAPTAGGLIVGLFVRYLMPGRKPQGVAQVIEASALRGGHMSIRAGFGAAVASVLSIGTGASVGREGPAIHLGATLGAWVAARLHLSRSMSRALLGCGVASAVAASFNAPIAGALFAHEVVVGHFALSAFAPIVIASVVGTVVSRAYFGDFPAFNVYEHPQISIFEFPAVVGLGILSGIVAMVLMRSIMLAEDGWAKTPGPQWLRPMAAGLIVGVIALAFPQILGVGYSATNDALQSLLPLYLLIALVLAKIVATAVCLGGGFGGGVFTPSLMVGAMLGGAYGTIATSIFPDLSSGAGAYTIIGMGAVASAVLGAPISTVLIVFELTDDYPLTIAVMVAVVLASVIEQQLHGRSYFTWQLERAGLDLKGGFERALLRSLHVHAVMKEESETVESATGILEVRRRLQDSATGELFVVGPEGQLVGTLTLHDLHDAAFAPEDEVDKLINAGDLARLHPPFLKAGDNLETANELVRDTGEHFIAVVKDAESMTFVGTLHETDLMAAYNRALVQAREEEHDGA